ncbi:uncharacterized protein LOC135497854 isoform X3 [Lineus longissimus]|uniref:uncharacterized protein LOC135497854 isoform X3 n=1 Tax=Lineus longissimus TaxID=88925 RepID=UPI00315CF863
MAGEKLEVVEVDGFEIRLEPHQVAYSIACWAGGFMLIVIIVLVIILFQRLIKRRNDKKNKTEIDIEEIDTGIRSNTSTGTDPNTNFIISKNEKSQEALKRNKTGDIKEGDKSRLQMHTSV